MWRQSFAFALFRALPIFQYRFEVACSNPEGWDMGSVTPITPTHPQWKIQSKGFLSSIGLDTLENYKVTMPAFNVGPVSARQRNAI